MIIIGEKLNGSIPEVARAIEERNSDFIRRTARLQAEAGASYLDVCASVKEEEAKVLKWMLEQAQAATELPLCPDSSDPEVLRETYGFCRNPGLLNSVSGGGGEENEQIYALLQDNPEWGVIAMLSDEKGIPGTAEGRMEVLERILERAASRGIVQERIYVDPMVEAAAFQEPKEEKTGVFTVLETIRGIRRKYPAIHITGAVSNISYGLPARRHMNHSFAALALEAGLDSMILDPLDKEMQGIICGTEALLGRKEEAFCMDYIRAYKSGRF